MPAAYEYAVLRVVPRVEREEFVNIGILLFCEARDVVVARTELDAARVLGLCPDLDLTLLRAHVEATAKICEGGTDAGPIGELPARERWRWLVSTRNTVLQTSAAHGGLARDEESVDAILEHLLDRMVRIPRPVFAPSQATVAAAGTVVAIEGLRVERDDVVMLDDLSLTIERGQNWAILGPNGCGKTSLLRALMGYLPGRGTIALLGERYGSHDWREMRKRVGLVSHALNGAIPPQETALATVITGRDATLGTWSEPTENDRAEARALLEQVGCGALAERPWTVLSQGERQRVLIARALLARPALLLLDEPCSGLDPIARERFLAFLDALAARSDAPTMVLVTHHLEEITPAFGHVLLLAGGRVVALGEKERVLTNERVGRAFGADVDVTVANERYALVVRPIAT